MEPTCLMFGWKVHLQLPSHSSLLVMRRLERDCLVMLGEYVILRYLKLGQGFFFHGWIVWIYLGSFLIDK